MSHEHLEDGSIVTPNFTLSQEVINRINGVFQHEWNTTPQMATNLEYRAGVILTSIAAELGWDDGHLIVHTIHDRDFIDVAWEIIEQATQQAQRRSASMN